MLRTLALGLISVFALAPSAEAQDWARKMFKETNHDFGSVARGAHTEYLFAFDNPYVEDVHIQSVRSSCGCTTPRIVTDTLKTHETGQIAAEFNTYSFQGNHSATITVVIDKPYYAEVQLNVKGYIRSDVVISPGAVNLGTVDQGGSAEQQATVTYAGRDSWQILEVRPGSDYLEGRVVETSRGNGQVGYDLYVTLKDNAPAGFIKEQVTLITNDSRMAEVPVEVEGRVVSQLSISPDSLLLGVLKPGQKVTKQLVLKSKRPFNVTGVKCDGDDSCFEFKTPEGAKPLQLVAVTFTAGNQPGKLARTITIETDLGPDACAECQAYAQIVPATEDAVAGK